MPRPLLSDHSASVTTTFKPGDVLRYTPYRHWCCESMAIVDDEGRALDNYWSHDRRLLTDAEVATAEALFNVNDYKRVKYRDEWETYHPDDRGRLTSQHGYHEDLYVRRGAEPDLSTQIANAEEQVAEAERELRSAQHSLEWRQRDLERLRAADAAASGKERRGDG